MTTATPTKYSPCPTPLTDAELHCFHEEGYLAFEDVLTRDEVDQAKAAISELVRRYARNNQEKLGAFWVQFEKGYKPTDPDSPDLELKVRKLASYQQEHPHFSFLALQHPRIQGVVSSLLGPKPILFQDMALIKPPLIGTEKPWHQDVAYFQVTPLGSICGVWIALDDASVENGCMHVIPGGHKLGPLRHFHGPVEGSGKDCQIMNGRIDPARAIPVELA